MINFFDNPSNEPSKFWTRNWVEINIESQGTYDPNNDIKFKTSMISSSLCDYSDAYMHLKKTITVPNTETPDSTNNANKKIIFENCASFTNCK